MRTALWCFTALLLLAAAAMGAPAIFGSAYIGSSGAATLYSIASANGAATTIGGGIGFTVVGALAFNSSGTLYGVGKNGSTLELLTINKTTGIGLQIGPLGVGGSFQDIAFRADGTLFGYDGGNLYTINTSTGAATLVGAVNSFPDGNALAFNSGGTLYYANQTELDTINQSTGAPTLVVALNYSAFSGENPRANGMKFDPASGTLYASVVTGSGGEGAVNYLGTINISSGVVTNLGVTVTGLDAIAISGSAPSGIPVPSTWLLVLAGIIGLTLFQVRERLLGLIRRA